MMIPSDKMVLLLLIMWSRLRP